MPAGRGRIRVIAGVLLALLLAITCAQAADRIVLECCKNGEDLAGRGNFSAALDAYNRAIGLDGEYAPAWYGKGVALNHLGRYAEANDAFDQSLLRDMEFVPSWNGKGVALHNLGRCREALTAYNYALALDPGNEYAKTNREMLIVRMAAEPTPAPTPSPRASTPWGAMISATPSPSATKASSASSASAAAARPPTNQDILYAKDVSPSQYGPAQGSVSSPVSAAPPSIDQGIAMVSSPESVNSGDLGAAMDVMASKGIKVMPTDNSTKNFLKAVDMAQSMSDEGEGSMGMSSATGGGAAPPGDLLSILGNVFKILG